MDDKLHKGRILPIRNEVDWDGLETRLHESQARLSLRCQSGPLHGRVLGSDGGPISIGRRNGCAIRLTVVECSRVHARIFYRSGQFWIEDLQTLNGTRLNGRPIVEPTPLGEGDRIQIGEQLMEVTLDDARGRQVVRDNFTDEPEAPAVSLGPLRAQPPSPTQPQPSWIAHAQTRRPGTRAPWAIAVLVLSGALGALVVRPYLTRRSSTVHAHAVEAAAKPAPLPVPVATATALAPLGREATFEIVTPIALRATSRGTVRKALERGARVDLDDEVVNYRESSAATNARLERLNEELEGDQDNAELAARAQQEALKLLQPDDVSLRSPIRGLVVSAIAKPGAHVHPGQELVRLAGAVRLRVSSEALDGEGPSCSIRFADQADLTVGAEPLPGATGRERVFVLAALPAELSTSAAGRVTVHCAAPTPPVATPIATPTPTPTATPTPAAKPTGR